MTKKTAPPPLPVDWDEVFYAAKRIAKKKPRATDQAYCDKAWRENAAKFGIVKQKAMED